LEKENLLNNMQFRFRPQRSTTDAILTITKDIYTGFMNKRIYCGSYDKIGICF
jgi:hypothetical protein